MQLTRLHHRLGAGTVETVVLTALVLLGESWHSMRTCIAVVIHCIALLCIPFTVFCTPCAYALGMCLCAQFTAATVALAAVAPIPAC